MAIIVFSSPKGGAGKTTAATVVACVLAARGAGVAVIDADPNRTIVEWAQLGGLPANLVVTPCASEEAIVATIEAMAARHPFVIVDLEGTASLMVSYAIAMADLVVIPVQGSQLDARQAARQIALIRAQERIVRRPIPFRVLITRTSAALAPKTLRHIEARLADEAVPVLTTRLYDREAYRALFSFGGTLEGLADKSVGRIDVAVDNARALAAELCTVLVAGSARKSTRNKRQEA